MQASMRDVFEDLGCSTRTAKAMVKTKVLIPWMTFVSSRMGMLRHYGRMSNALEVQLGETTGEPTWGTWLAK